MGPTGVELWCEGTIVYQTYPSTYTSPCRGIGPTDPAYGNILETNSVGLIFKVGKGPWRGYNGEGQHSKGSGVLVLAVNDGLKGCPAEWGTLGCFADNSGAYSVSITPVPIDAIGFKVRVKGAPSNDRGLLADISGGGGLDGGPADPPLSHDIVDYTSAGGSIDVTFKKLGTKALRLKLVPADGQLEVGVKAGASTEEILSIKARVVSTSDPKACRRGSTVNLTFHGGLNEGTRSGRLSISVCGKTYTFPSARTVIWTED